MAGKLVATAQAGPAASERPLRGPPGRGGGSKWMCRAKFIARESLQYDRDRLVKFNGDRFWKRSRAFCWGGDAGEYGAGAYVL